MGSFLATTQIQHTGFNGSMYGFHHIQKSYIVAIPPIESIENNEMLTQEHRISISRNYKEKVLKQVVDDQE